MAKCYPLTNPSLEAVAKYLLSVGCRWTVLMDCPCSFQKHLGHFPARTSSSITAPSLRPTSNQSDELVRSHDVRAMSSSSEVEYTWEQKINCQKLFVCTISLIPRLPCSVWAWMCANEIWKLEFVVKGRQFYELPHQICLSQNLFASLFRHDCRCRGMGRRRGGGTPCHR